MEERCMQSIRRVGGAVCAMCVIVLAVPCLATAQEPTAPPASSSGSREIPRPDQLEPGVSTTPTAPAAPTSRETPTAAPAASRTAAPAPGSSAAAAPAAAAAVSPQTAPSGTAAASATSGTRQGPAAAKAGARKGPDRLELDTTDITGNRELPKVLYIVPWKRSDLGDVVGKPVNSLLDEVLQPLDRDVFRRENRYYDSLQAGPGESKAGTAQGSQPKP
jgi:type IV secretory pathway VirB10-like protein